MTTLLTLHPSHFCEKARLALRLAGLPFDERSYLPMAHLLPVRRATGQRLTPALLPDDGPPVVDSTAILGWIDRHPDARWRPYAAGPAALELEELFDKRVGPPVRLLTYAFLMDDPALTRDTFGRWDAHGRWWVMPALPVVVAAMRRGLGIDKARIPRSSAAPVAALAAADAALADGRPWLAGDQLSAADVTLAGLLAPLVGEPRYHAALPDPARLPEAFHTMTAPWKARPAAAIVGRVYDAVAASSRAASAVVDGGAGV